MRWATSSKAAVWPPMNAWASWPSRVAGTTSFRSSSTRSCVSESCGEVVGKTVTTAVSPASFTFGSLTDSTPGVCRKASARRSAAPGADPWSTVTSSGPLKPGPKPSASRS